MRDIDVTRVASDGKSLNFKGYCYCSGLGLPRECVGQCKVRKAADVFFDDYENELWLKHVGCEIVHGWKFSNIGVEGTVALDVNKNVVAHKMGKWEEHATNYRRRYRVKAIAA